jgi:Papain family cysteine protease
MLFLHFCLISLLSFTVAQYPSEYDPRLASNPYNFCFGAGNPILNQGRCGACYATSSATTISIAICIAMIKNGMSPSNVFVSSEFTLAVAKYLGSINYYGPYGASIVYSPCSGGDQLTSVLQPFANLISYSATQFNATPFVASCTSSTTNACSGGCAPFTQFSCPNFQSPSPNNAAWIASNPQLCPNDFSLSTCQNNGPIDAISASLINALSQLNATTEAFLFLSYAANTRGQQQPIPISNWLPSDIAALKTYLSTVGPTTIALSACAAWGGFYSDGARATQPYSGDSCLNPYEDSHAATLIGYKTINGVDSWILQNSYGVAWGDSGYFYVPTATGGSSVASTGSLSLNTPASIYFTRWNGNKATTPVTTTTQAANIVSSYLRAYPQTFSPYSNAIPGSFSMIVNQTTMYTYGQILQMLVNTQGTTLSGYVKYCSVNSPAVTRVVSYLGAAAVAGGMNYQVQSIMSCGSFLGEVLALIFVSSSGQYELITNSIIFTPLGEYANNGSITPYEGYIAAAVIGGSIVIILFIWFFLSCCKTSLKEEMSFHTQEYEELYRKRKFMNRLPAHVSVVISRIATSVRDSIASIRSNTSRINSKVISTRAPPVISTKLASSDEGTTISAI